MHRLLKLSRIILIFDGSCQTTHPALDSSTACYTMKIVDILFVILFIYFAEVQFNDADPYIWVTLYGIVALVPLLALFNKYNLPLVKLAMVLCLAGLVMTGPGVYEILNQQDGASIFQEMTPEKMYIEVTREFLGLLIAQACLGFYFFRSRRAQGKAKTTIQS